MDDLGDLETYLLYRKAKARKATKSALAGAADQPNRIQAAATDQITANTGGDIRAKPHQIEPVKGSTLAADTVLADQSSGLELDKGVDA